MSYLLRVIAPTFLLTTFVTSCIPEDTDTNGDSEEYQCEVPETTTTYTVPEITYVEVDETTDANDTAETAQTIALNTIVSGDMSYPSFGGCVDCDDYYTVPVQAGDEVEVIIEGVSGTNFDLYLYDGSSFSVYSNGGEPVEKINYTIPEGMENLIILANAYDGTGDYTLTVTKPAEPVAVVNDQSDACLANLSGTIGSAIDDSKLANVTINLREGSDTKTGDISETASSGANGEYSFANIDAGTYTAEIVLEGYATIYQKIVAKGKTTTIQNFSMSPTLAAGEIRIVLTWGENPRDLDGFLEVPVSGSQPVTVGYQNKSSNGASLDRDDTTSYGPETITIATQQTGAYSYYVKPFRGTSSSLQSSNAAVSVYDENGLIETINVVSGSGYKWNVFTLTDGAVTVQNTITD
jgi:uncharacterized protein YfaP (DUF2135 family)